MTINNGSKRKVMVHRLVFSAFIGEIPSDKVVDHIDENKSNNHPDNLRAIPNGLNVSRSSRLGSCGLRGVCQVGSRFPSRITHGGKSIHLGTFDSPQEAHDAYLRKRGELGWV